MPIISKKILCDQIKSQNIKKSYLIYGEEKYLVKFYLDVLSKKILNKNTNSFNLQKFNGQNLNIDLLKNSIEALPLLAQNKCVCIFNLDIEKESSDNIKKIKSIIESIPNFSTLIIAQTYVDIDLKRSAKWRSFIDYFSKFGDILNFDFLDKETICKQLIAWSNKELCKLSKKNAELIIDKCGNNLSILENEIIKLCAYTNKSEITNKIINQIVIENFDTNVFDLAKALVVQKFDTSISILRNLIDKKVEPVLILATIISFYVDIYRVKLAKINKKTISNVTEIFNYKNKLFKLKNAQRYAENLSMTKIQDILNLLKNADFNLKTSNMNSKFLLENLILKISICE